ncbi:unnamed protein product [Dicrocoelium dendriticum]|nr:unnamed protein product [Dicrocoelium dendriticum]
MELFPSPFGVLPIQLIFCHLAPFSLGTSLAKISDILPAVVHIDPRNPDKATVGCQIGPVYYSNTNCSSLKDTNFATIIFNKKTEEIHVVHKKPEFLSPCFKDTEPSATSDSLAVDRKALTEAFGSVKRQRVLKEIERHADHRAAMTDAAVITRTMHGQKRLKSDVADAEAASSGDTQPTDERTRLLPPFNPNAAIPQDVYMFDRLIPSRILEALGSEAETLATAPIRSYETWSQEGLYQKCVIDRLLRTAALGGSNEQQKNFGSRMRNAQCLAYLSHMLTLYNLPARAIQRKQPLPNTPAPVAKHLLSEFTVMINHGSVGKTKLRFISPVTRDRLIYHMLALILHCDNFATIVDELTVDFRLSCDALRRYLLYMGCRVHKEETNESEGTVHRTKAVLVTPVKFPHGSLHRTKSKNMLL